MGTRSSYQRAPRKSIEEDGSEGVGGVVSSTGGICAQCMDTHDVQVSDAQSHTHTPTCVLAAYMYKGF